MTNISLYTVYHKNSHIIKNSYIKPIQVGDGASIENIDYRDNQGINIAEKNNSYCELTAQYWAWKNDKNSDYIGIMHYRRFFDFNVSENRVTNKFGILEEPEFTLDFINNYCLSESEIEEQVKHFDIILPEVWDVKNIHYKSLNEHYEKAPFHHKKDLEITRKVIAEKYPQDIAFFDKALNSSTGYFTNMFILKKALFNKYSEWLFNILSEVENRTNISVYDTQEKRVFGYLSERLFNVWLLKYKNENKDTKINYLRRVFILETKSKQWFSKLPETSKPITSIAIASDNNYVPHLGALIASILDNTTPDSFIDFIILDGGISQNNRRLLKKMMSPESSIQFLDLEGEFKNQAVHMHFSRATFYRLIIDKLISDREKVLYIDCDTIVLDDVSKLFNIDLNGYTLGAVYDYIMHAMCNLNVPSIDFAGSLPAKEYLQNYVGLGDNWDKYFQAGIILFDLKKLRELNISSIMIKSLLDKRYWFLDQDILNKYFIKNIKYLEPNWNTVNCEINAGLTEIQQKELAHMFENPKIIHYAGYEAKPWNNFEARFHEYYFYYLRKTFWYESVIAKIPNLPYRNEETHQLVETTIYDKIFKPFIKIKRGFSSGNRYRKGFCKLVKQEKSIGKAYQRVRQTYKTSGIKSTKLLLKNQL